ncbi:MAG: histidinol-phosphatase, partial [Candidatus Electrothrix sp. MAN1_4]|nr:histidinol-phosphatase [Candidatus Electrothrix sp. MAN1_4]
GRSDKNILQVAEELEKIHRDYFLIFAHVEQGNGLWQAMEGGKLGDFKEKRYALVRQRTLGFQKVRTHDERANVQRLLKETNWYPAEVEGSDCKLMNAIGRCGKQKDETGKEVDRETWLKIGEFTFEAVKYALADWPNRVRAKQPEKYPHSHIKSIVFDGGILDGQQVDFSAELNTLIGIRGSGKSSVLESVRYVLNIPFGEKTKDQQYKDALIAHTLGSGGKATIVAVDKYEQEYRISRIFNEQPKVFVGDELKPGIALRETVIHKPIYFGQKDLSSTGEGFEKDLVEKLVGEKLQDIRRQIEEQKFIVSGQCDKLLNLASIDEKIKENNDKQQDAEYRLKIFQDNGIEDKLKKQTYFNTDKRKIKAILNDIHEYENAVTEVVDQYEDELKNHLLYRSKQNEAFFNDFFTTYQAGLDSFAAIKAELRKIRVQSNKLQEKKAAFIERKKEQSEQFAEIRRKLEADLRQQDKQLNLEEFPQLQKTIETTKQLLKSLHKESRKRSVIKDELVKALSKLNDLWHQEFKLIDTELKKINENNTALQISSTYKGDTSEFLQFLTTIFRGSRIRENSFRNIVHKHTDCTSIFNDLDKVKKEIGGSAETFEQYFFDNLKELLTWQTPNRFIVQYRQKELHHHSLGQRASALILFVLSQKENDLVIIDQPEDDLDNQTIYEDVIKLVKKLKPQTQFIFATHNPNFPVLGDAEQIHACRYGDETVQINSGSIDSPIIQQEIVDIMEGGEDAFNKRKEIYQIWKPQNSLK